MVNVQSQRPIAIFLEFVTVADRVTFDWILCEKMFRVVCGYRPERALRRKLTFKELDCVPIRAAQRLAIHVRYGARINSIFWKVRSQIEHGDSSAKEIVRSIASKIRDYVPAIQLLPKARL